MAVLVQCILSSARASLARWMAVTQPLPCLSRDLNRCNAMKSSSVTLLGAGALAILSAGCMTEPISHLQADGTYCYRVGRSHRPTLTCTTTAVPSDAMEVDAKRFLPSPGAVTLYLVRRRWADDVNRVPVTIDGRTAVQTIPRSVIRVRTPPGDVEVSFELDGRTERKRVSAESGELVFLEIEGSVWEWGATYRWDDSDAVGAKQRATKSKLIADLDFRQ